nr:unnamed protein product [Spirometra erinaceieuropaei]
MRHLNDGMTARVTEDGAVSEAFAVTNGVKQGCVLAPTRFSLMYFAMLIDAYREKRPGMHFQSCVSTTTFRELLYANDCALNTTTEGDMQRSSIPFDAACDNFGLMVNVENTVAMHQPPPDADYNAPHINADGARLQVVGIFTYLSSIHSRR